MKNFTFLLSLFVLLNTGLCRAQSYFQDFDGDDTSVYNSIFVHLDTSSQNIWQIGEPRKPIFDSAYSPPNAIATGLTMPYPVNNTSIFTFSVPVWNFMFGGFAVQWVQKLDMDSARDGGIVEVSLDRGNSWQNVFKLPFIYDFYGYPGRNVDTLPSGQVAFSGTDSSWEDIWLCFNLSVLSGIDTMQFRFTFTSDSINNNREGWMIDNLSAHITLVHPVNVVNKDPYLSVYPRMTNGPVNIKSKITDGSFKIESAELLDESGQEVEQFEIGPNEAQIYLGNHANGWYFLKVTTSAITKTYSIWLNCK